MTREEFDKIIEFAILREQDAVEFYHQLQKHAKFADQKQMLIDFENMEKGHIIVLKNIHKKGLDYLDPNRPSNMKTSDYILANYDDKDLSYENILVRAIKREEYSYKLYKDLATKFPDTEVAVLFKNLAAEEIKHKNHFSGMYDKHVLKDN
ncbi:MAG: ferritin family protein [Candidatus Cloacimonadales bacterium]